MTEILARQSRRSDLRIFRSTAVFVLVAVASIASLRAREVEEIPNWPAPPFWSEPVKWEKGVDAVPMSVEGAGTQALPFAAIPPCRIADTRGNSFTGQAGPPTVLANTVRTFQVTGTIPGVSIPCNVPVEARAVSLQFSVTNMTSGGNLIAWPSGPAPTTSVLNWNATSVAIGNGTVVQLTLSGSLNVQVNAPLGQAADLIIDVNGYYHAGGLDSVYVNEFQVDSVNSSMILDGSVLNADVGANAAIVDTKLATIATAGKVADTALSANVSKLGQTIDNAELSANSVTVDKIPNLTRSVGIPLTTFFDCGGAVPALVGVASGTDAKPDFANLGEGTRVSLLFDATAGSPDQNYKVCSGFNVPLDYASGGLFVLNATLTSLPGGATEVLNCSAGRAFQAHGDSGTVLISSAANTGWQCTPTLTGLAAGEYVDFSLMITSDGTMDDPVRLNSIEFRYAATH
jgi:hypothetical protein